MKILRLFLWIKSFKIFKNTKIRLGKIVACRFGQTDNEFTTKGKTGIRTGYRNNNKLKKEVKDIYEKKSIEELLSILSKMDIII